MNAALVLFCGFLVGYSTAQRTNPACADLDAIKKNVESALKVVGTATCHRNKNCSGMACHGNVGGKSFNGTVILQGCQEPVTMLVHWHNRVMTVHDGFQKQITPNIHVVTNFRKVNNSIYVTIKIKVCRKKFPYGCLPIPLVDDKRIRVQCNGSNIPVFPWSNQPTYFSPYTRQPGHPSRGGDHNFPTHGSKTRLNADCKALESTKKTVERQFALLRQFYHDSAISCNPAQSCTELKCSGISHGDHFTATAMVDYCSSPIRLRVTIHVPKVGINISHEFKNGEQMEISKSHAVFVTVHLKRDVSKIHVNVSLSFLGLVKRDLIRNMTITVDPSRCQGYHVSTRRPHRQCPLQKVKESVEDKFPELGKGAPDSPTTINCEVLARCSELRCVGKLRNDNFTTTASMSYCPDILHMKTDIDDKTYKHDFKDGDSSKVPLPTTVQMKRTGNQIALSMSVNNHYLIRNMIVTVGSSCPATVSTRRPHRQCPLQKVKESVEDKFPELGKGAPDSPTTINCEVLARCSELRCVGKLRNDNFTTTASMSYCPDILHMKTDIDDKTYKHDFKDGDSSKVPLPTTVQMKRTGNQIALSMSVNNRSLIRNMIVTVGSSCPTTAMSAGAIAGIVVGGVVVVAILVAVVMWLTKGRCKPLGVRVARYNDLAMSDDTAPLYDDFEPAIA